MKFRVGLEGTSFLLEVNQKGKLTAYTVSGTEEQSGVASVEEVMPGAFSVLSKNRSLQVNVAPHPAGFEVWVGCERHVISLADPRDEGTGLRKAGTAGPVELRAQMPGKIIKLLVPVGTIVQSGQGLIVVEAMKMQNEVKAPKDGIITRIQASEGETVSAGDLLLVVE